MTNSTTPGGRHDSQLTFTCDFHELLHGTLEPGSRLAISYDPLRCARLHPHAHPAGHETTPEVIHAIIKFDDSAKGVEHRLLRPGIKPVQTVPERTGQGDMLWTLVTVPADAQYVCVWFRHVDPDGHVHWDSDFGRDFWFGFPTRDIPQVGSEVVPGSRPGTRDIQISATTDNRVEALSMRYYHVSDPEPRRHEAAFTQVDVSPKRWRFRATVGEQTVLRYKLYYIVGGRKFKHDNSGSYFLAPEPAVRSKGTLPAALRQALS